MVHSRRLFAGASVQPFTYQPDTQLAQALHDLDVGALSEYVYHDLPLGRMVLPALRWILRRHHLDDDAATRQFLREYILSAYKVFQEFTSLVEKTNPQAVVVFNGMFFPEAVVRWVALCRGIRVLTHEVGFRPFSVFFTDGEATAYPIVIPESFTLSPRQNERLEAYLSQRFKGNFSMAGIRFWPEMRGLDEKILERISQHKQVVPVFTNVIFDTSQVHANTVFPHMFAWLEEVLGIIRAHPETLFVIRAHPDEMRTTKASRESVRDWVISHQVDLEPNVIFIDSNEFISSYDLILRSKFVMIYNSSIGLEAAILGTPVLCGGKARFTQYPIVFFPSSPQAYRQLTEQFLGAKKIDLPVEFQLNARRFLYYHLYKVSLPFDDFLASDARPGFVRLKEFSWQQLLPQQSQVLQIIYAGITEGKPFVMEG